MLKLRRTGKLLLGFAAAVAAAAAAAVGASAIDADTLILTGYEQPAAEGCMTVGIKGSYINETDSLLAKINTARYEACRDGVPDPNDPSKKLTPDDFVPAQYSSELEGLARLRSAEAVLVYGHTRPNGKSCFSLETSSDFRYQAESLAWNDSGSAAGGLEQFLKEKTDWVHKTAGAVTGHYTQMINPENRYVGIGCFKTSDTTGYSTALCVRYGRSDENLDGSKGAAVEDCIVPVQVPEDNFSNARIKAVKGSKTIPSQEYSVFEFRGTVSFAFKNGTKDTTWDSDVILYDTKWSSDNTAAAEVDKYGKVTAVKSGSARITAESANDTVGFKVTVKPGIDECTVTIPYSSYTYRGRGIKPTVTVKFGEEKLVKGTDFTVEYSDNVNVGTAKITVKGIGKYSGTGEKTFKIKPLDVTSSYAKVTIPYASYTFTGKEICPAVKLKFKDGSVIPASEYTVEYADNVKVGLAKIKVTARTDNIKGTFDRTFVVKPAKNQILSISSAKGAFKLKWTKATEGSTGYQVLYSTKQDFSENVHSYTSKDLEDVTENFSKVPKPGEIWYVKVRSFTEQNNTRYGNYSKVLKIYINR